MNMLKLNVKTLTVPEIAIIAATRGALGFGATTCRQVQTGKTESARLVVVPFRSGEHDPDCDARLQKGGASVNQP
jgi:hypothetical protein